MYIPKLARNIEKKDSIKHDINHDKKKDENKQYVNIVPKNKISTTIPTWVNVQDTQSKINDFPSLNEIKIVSVDKDNIKFNQLFDKNIDTNVYGLVITYEKLQEIEINARPYAYYLDYSYLVHINNLLKEKSHNNFKISNKIKEMKTNLENNINIPPVDFERFVININFYDDKYQSFNSISNYFETINEIIYDEAFIYEDFPLENCYVNEKVINHNLEINNISIDCLIKKNLKNVYKFNCIYNKNFKSGDLKVLNLPNGIKTFKTFSNKFPIHKDFIFYPAFKRNIFKEFCDNENTMNILDDMFEEISINSKFSNGDKILAEKDKNDFIEDVFETVYFIKKKNNN